MSTVKSMAVVATEVGKISIQEVEIGDPKKGEVRVKVIASGICHTDLGAINSAFPPEFGLSYPLVPGHEGVGIVESVGEGVMELAVGDKVIMSYPSCVVCDMCKKNRPWACRSRHQLFFGGKFADGTKRIVYKGQETASFFGQGSWSQYCIVAERNAVKVDPDVDVKMLCSLGCGIQTGFGCVVNRAKPDPGSTIAVFGCGTVGLAAIMAAKATSCSTIIGVDQNEDRLALAKELGATHTINTKEIEDPVKYIQDLTGGYGVEYTIECTGVPILLEMALNCLDQNGMSVIVGVTGTRSINIQPEPVIMDPSRTWTGMVEGGSIPKVFIPRLVQLYKDGKIPLEKLVKFYEFKDVEQAIADTVSGEIIKPVLMMPE